MAKGSRFMLRNPLWRIARGRGNERGQALVEYAIVFPLQLMMTLAIIQLAHLFVAKQVLDYAAFCGARAKLVGLEDEDVHRAAAIPITRIAGPAGVSEAMCEEAPIIVPGWGELPNWEAAYVKTLGRYGYGSLETDRATLEGEPAIRCDLTHLYELRVPIGNIVAYHIGDVFLSEKGERLEKVDGVPHIRMQASCTLAQPWQE